MKKIYSILGTFLLVGCAQDMGHYVNLPAKISCKIVTISPNLYGMEQSTYNKLLGWAKKQLPALGYTVLGKVREDSPRPCGEVTFHYSRQGLAMAESDTTFLYRHQLTLYIQDIVTQEKLFSVATELESSEADEDKMITDMENALNTKFLQVKGPESHVETIAVNKILST